MIHRHLHDIFQRLPRSDRRVGRRLSTNVLSQVETVIDEAMGPVQTHVLLLFLGAHLERQVLRVPNRIELADIECTASVN